MGGMFTGAKVFNQNLSDWNITAVSDMGNMFQYASALSEPTKEKFMRLSQRTRTGLTIGRPMLLNILR